MNEANDPQRSSVAKSALFLFLFGLLAPPVLILLVLAFSGARPPGRAVDEAAPFAVALGLIAEVLALILGIVGRRYVAGKIAWIGATVVFGLALLGNVLWIFSSYSRRPPPNNAAALPLSNPSRMPRFYDAEPHDLPSGRAEDKGPSQTQASHLPTASRGSEDRRPIPKSRPTTLPAGAAEAAKRQDDAVKTLGVNKELVLDLGTGVTMKLVLIPAGTFLMGSGETEKDHVADEAQHEVTISKPFFLGVTHVTVDQFAAFAKDSGYQTDAEKAGWSYGFEVRDGAGAFKKMDGVSWRKASFDQKGDHPVVQVSWNDARAFCDWLSRKTGKTVHLPTEAQWEYACRAGTKTAYPWGDDPDDGTGWANCADLSLQTRIPNAVAALSPVGQSRVFGWDDGFVFTSPAGSFKANAFGLHDMIGNAAQWCQDRYGDYETGAATDPGGPDTGDRRVLRGGSWINNTLACRSARRSKNSADVRHALCGFRVAVGGFK